jgi:acetyl-CoA carboxylase/biotin carboxylase 1
LTGYQALNKLMGREIYVSNEQLGGPMIMYSNGVSHAIGTTHVELLTLALKWLSYVPNKRGGYLPVLDITGKRHANVDMHANTTFRNRHGRTPRAIFS